VRPAPKPGEADKKDEDEIRKEKLKSDSLKKPKAEQSNSIIYSENINIYN